MAKKKKSSIPTLFDNIVESDQKPKVVVSTKKSVIAQRNMFSDKIDIFVEGEQVTTVDESNVQQAIIEIVKEPEKKVVEPIKPKKAKKINKERMIYCVNVEFDVKDNKKTVKMIPHLLIFADNNLDIELKKKILKYAGIDRHKNNINLDSDVTITKVDIVKEMNYANKY